MTTQSTQPPAGGVSNSPLPSAGRHALSYYIAAGIAAALMAAGVPTDAALFVAGPVAGALGGLWRLIHR